MKGSRVWPRETGYNKMEERVYQTEMVKELKAKASEVSYLHLLKSVIIKTGVSLERVKQEFISPRNQGK